MVKCVLVLALLICTILAVDEGKVCDVSKCPKSPKQYLELGCTPIKDANQCCIERFDCPERIELEEGQCVFKNVTYETGDKIPAASEENPCFSDCFCDVDRITCTDVQCPEYFRPLTLLFQGPYCVIQHHNKNQCCTSGVICGQTDLAKLATCDFEGQTYKDGQSMQSNVDKCVTCICEEGFDGKLDYKSCRHRHKSCGFELFNSKPIEDGCIPLYYGEDSCCPANWRCPESTDAVVTGTHTSGQEDSDLECSFGNLTLQRGDSLSPWRERCTTCSCEIPPLVGCVIDPVCYEREP